MKKSSIILTIISLGLAIKERHWPLVCLIVILGIVVVCVRKFPKNPIIRVLFVRFGTSPSFGERQSSYLFRLSAVALATAILISAVTYTVLKYNDAMLHDLDKYPFFSATFIFGMPIFIGMAVLSMLSCFLKGIWIRIRGKDSLYLPPDELTKNKCNFNDDDI